ncbi:MAG: Ku protein [Pigmentiphaga sp.]
MAMAAPSKRVLWKGAISFGLVHIPIALHSATEEQSIDFDWLDKRSMDPVGYKRINKATGKEITKENIVKGIEYEDGQYVVLSSEEIAEAYPKTTQTVEIEAFVPLKDIPFVYLERPYYISPINKGAKVYALLREVLRKSNKVGIAKVVIQTKQHLALLLPCGPALILNLLRWEDEIRPWDALNLPAEGTESTGLTEKELAMGEQLIDDMTGKWKPEDFTDSFKEQILQLVKEKVEAGDIESVHEPEAPEVEIGGAKILDLTEMLRRSLNKGGTPDRTAGKPPGKPANKAKGKAAPKKAAAKTPAKKSATRAKATKKTAAKSSRKAA